MAVDNPKSYKYLGLLLLTTQQACMPLMARYTRYREEKDSFFTTVDVFMMEVIKLFTAIFLFIYTSQNSWNFFMELKVAIYDNRIESAKVCVPALIYTLQNNLYYMALTHLEATTFCIAYQMKIFTTAILMYFLLGKRLSNKQWLALVILVIGVADVQLVYAPPQGNPNIYQKPLIGFLAVITMCFTSAFADGFFRGWDFLVVCLTVTNSIGGLLISVVIKYADNILKAYAQSMAIIGAALGSWLLFDFVPGFFFTLGSSLVISSIILYTLYPYQQRYDLSQFSNTKTPLLMIKATKGAGLTSNSATF
ncbi:hypothetical protein WR25_03004 [Diploscapter pachys]|uniref:Uncharacterized protein n=1 Tax=Diploscapter pachys TaxID=2018661 RepID=A0A2A2KUC5_9BILA|nr:hypothetical protein WR25_03004 [Diploscapter pachys]